MNVPVVSTTRRSPHRPTTSGTISIPHAGARAGVEGLDWQPDDAGRFLRVPQRGLGGCGRGRIDEHGNTNGLRHKLMQEFQPLCDDLRPTG
jgi:hypothetical protein